MGKNLLLRVALFAIAIGVISFAHSYVLANSQTESLIKASLKAGLKSVGLGRFVPDANRPEDGNGPPHDPPGPPPWAPGPPHDPPGPPCNGQPPGGGCPVSPVR